MRIRRIASRKTLTWVGLAAIFLTFWALSAGVCFLTSDRSTTAGPFAITISPSLSGHAVIDGGGLLPTLRVPSGREPFGVDLRVDGLETGTLGQAVTSTAIVASSPEGELANMNSVLVSMMKDSLVFGFLLTTALALALRFAWLLIGADRRRELTRLPLRAKKQLVICGALLLTMLMPLPMIFSPESEVKPQPEWILLRSLFPELPQGDQWGQLEVEGSALTTQFEELVRGAVNSYRESLAFYGKLAEKASAVEGLRMPEVGERTALIVADRHDNTPMDQVAKALGDQVGARIVLDLGDDTSTGGKWELFSVNSLAKTFESYDAIVAVPGNHDSGTYVAEAMRKKGIIVLDGEIESVGGLRLLGEPDPRATEFGRGYLGDDADAEDSINGVDASLTEVACAGQEDGLPLSAVLIHAPSAAEDLTASGCAPLVLSGHLHHQVGPLVSTGPFGETAKLTTGTTGGAAYAFALGAKLRRPAQVSILTYNDEGQPVGLQVIDLDSSGLVLVQDYFSLAQVGADVGASSSTPDQDPLAISPAIERQKPDR